MRKRRVQLLLVILIGLTPILLGDHLLSGRMGEGSAPKRAVVAPFGAPPESEGSALPSNTKLAAFPADSPNARFESRSITNQKSPITNPLIQNPKSKIQNGYGRLPLSFEANQGQTDARVRFLARGGGYTIFLTDDEAVLTLRKSQPGMGRLGKLGLPGRLEPFGPVEPRAARWPSRAADWKSLWPSLIPDLGQLVPDRNAGKGGPARGLESQPPQVVRMRLVGGNAKARVVGLDELPGRSNYFIGSDPKKWRTNVPSYTRVKYEGIYPGVDLVYYGNQRQLEYDFVVARGADPNQIKLSFAGAAGMRVHAPSGDLVVKVGDDELRFQKPAVYQPAVAAVSSSPSSSVAPASGLDARHSSLVTRHCSFVLASNNEVAFRVAGYDPKRALVIDPVLSYSTYLGGGGADEGFGIAVDVRGNAYVTGYTDSTDFPTANPLQPGYGGGGEDAFVAKLNPAGSALVYSTYLGGSSNDWGYGIAADAAGNAYLTGETWSTDFPIANPLQPSSGGGLCDAFVAKLNPAGSGLVYSTYLGGDYQDSGSGIAVDAAGDAYVTGWTQSPDFPTANPLQGKCGDCNGHYFDAFVATLNPAGSALVYSTYLGGSYYDAGNGIAVDPAGNAYVTGWTDSTDFPTANPLQQSYGGGLRDAFVAKLNAAGSALVYSTYVGGSDWDQGNGIAVDVAGNAYVTGFTLSADFPTANPLQHGYGGRYDAFVAKLNPAGSALVYSTYLGGSSHDEGDAIAVDATGNAYITGCTYSSDFPTANPLQGRCGGCNPSLGPSDAFVAKLNATGSALVYSTYLGGSDWDWGFGIAVDAAGDAFVTGYTGSTDFPTASPLRASFGGVWDAFVAKISKAKPFLGFPLADQGPFSARLNTVFDHLMQSGGDFHIYGCDEAVQAFTGELGNLDASAWYAGCRHGYAQDKHTSFYVNGEYCRGGNDSRWLYYDGHPGIDYHATFGTEVLAATHGIVHYPTWGQLKSQGIDVGGDPDSYRVLELDPTPANGYRVFYLHLSTHPRTISLHLTADISGQDFVGTGGGGGGPTPLPSVSAGQDLVGTGPSGGLAEGAAMRVGSAPTGGFAISGTVLANRNPVLRATIRLTGINEALDCGTSVPPVSTYTDKQGHYLFAGLPEGYYNLRATKSGYAFSASNRPEIVEENHPVKALEHIADSGNAFDGCLVPHLHFEVQKKVSPAVTNLAGGGKETLSYVPVDPYGWDGHGQDPYYQIVFAHRKWVTDTLNDRLWLYQPVVESIGPSSVSPGKFELQVFGQGFQAGGEVCLPSPSDNFANPDCRPATVASKGAQLSLEEDLSSAGEYFVYVQNPDGHRSNWKKLVVTSP